MVTVYQANEQVRKFWTGGKPKDTEYRPLRYLLKLSCGDGVLLQHLVTGELLLLTEAESARLDALPRAYEPWMDELIRKNFLVPSAQDDAELVGNLRRLLSLTVRGKEITGYTVLPTSGCNARCFYCYECDIPKTAMTAETADALTEYMAAHCGGKKLHIGWFGGEPLLGEAIIDRICANLRAKGVAYSSGIITNGYLFTPALADKAKADWALSKAQITLDGTEETYNRTKAYVNAAENPYRRVLRNIGLLADRGLPVNVRLNLGPHNAEELEALIRELAERFTDKTCIRPYVAVLTEDTGYEPYHAGSDGTDKLYARRAELMRLTGTLGFTPPAKSGRPSTPSLKLTYCMADNPGSLVVNPEGGLGKCEHFSFEKLVGDLKHGITDRQTLAAYGETDFGPGCGKCTLYPVCKRLKLCIPKPPCNRYKKEELLEKEKARIRAVYAAYRAGAYAGEDSPEADPPESGENC